MEIFKYFLQKSILIDHSCSVVARESNVKDSVIMIHKYTYNIIANNHGK